MSMATITCGELAELLRNPGQPTDLIDVRTPAEYRAVHVEASRLIPLSNLDPHEIIRLKGSSSTDPIYFICKTGARSRLACEKFIAAGYSHVVNVAEGTIACEAAGIPVVRGKSAISLDRQVRIAAGSLVVIGTALGAFVSPWFLAISGFVGAGLVFSGVTDTCGMAIILARMPWNRV